MSAPTRTRPRKRGGLSARRRDELIVEAEVRVVDAEIRVLNAPDDDEAKEALGSAERELQHLYAEHRMPKTRYSNAMAGLLVIDVERGHLGKVPAGVRGALDAELSRREAGIWDGIAEVATRPAGPGGTDAAAEMSESEAAC